MKEVTTKYYCDRCGKEIEFIIANGIFARDVIRIQRRRAVTNHGEDWIDVDLCKSCEEDAVKFWNAK